MTPCLSFRSRDRFDSRLRLCGVFFLCCFKSEVFFFLAGEKGPHLCIFEGGGEALYSALVAPLVFGYWDLTLNLGPMVDYRQGGGIICAFLCVIGHDK